MLLSWMSFGHSKKVISCGALANNIHKTLNNDTLLKFLIVQIILKADLVKIFGNSQP